MKIQNYLASSNKGELTFCLDYLHEGQNNKNAIILVGGFSESLIDLDYYMTKLSKYLFDQGDDVFQVDLYAHGDSTGTAESITITKLKNSIVDVIEHAVNNGFSSVVIISRGIMGTLMCDFFDDNPLVTKMISINPWYYPPVKSKELYDLVNKSIIPFAVLLQGYCQGIEELPQEIKDTINVYSELGLFNQTISKEFFEDIMRYDYSNFERCKKAVFFETDNKKASIMSWKTNMGYRTNQDFDYISLVLDAIWHFRTYEIIYKCLKGET